MLAVISVRSIETELGAANDYSYYQRHDDKDASSPYKAATVFRPQKYVYLSGAAKLTSG